MAASNASDQGPPPLPPPVYVGYCIFCDGPGETDDHIVPMALGGAHKLTKSSCEKCRDELNKQIDAPVLNGYLLRARLKSKRPRNKRRPAPTHVKANYSIGTIRSGDKLITDMIPVDDAPNVFVLPIVAPPSIITGYKNDPDVIVLKGLRFADGFNFPQDGNTHWIGTHEEDLLFFRMIAKIGLSTAFLNYNRSQFTPLVRDAILGIDRDILHYVGIGPDVRKMRALYRLNIREEGKYLIASVQLFADLGMPNYDVVVGLRKGWGIFR